MAKLDEQTVILMPAFIDRMAREKPGVASVIARLNLRRLPATISPARVCLKFPLHVSGPDDQTGEFDVCADENGAPRQLCVVLDRPVHELGL